MKALRVISPVLLLGWMALIFMLSAETSAESSQTSGSVITVLARFLYPGFENLSAADKAQLVESMQFVTRKAAHFSCYGVLGILSFLSLVTYRRIRYAVRIALSAAVCLLYAVGDEIHQLYVPGRSGELRDICIDFSGALLGILFSALIIRISGRLYGKLKTEGLTEAMNKKQLFELNNELRAQLAAEESRAAALKAEISRRDGRITELTAEIERLTARLDATPPLKELEAKMTRRAAVSKDTEYGAAVIGRLVIEAAKYCNRLTAGEQSGEVKELVNLILGRTEVAKAEILKIVTSDKPSEQKSEETDRCFEQAADYFKSVMAQKG